MTLICADTFEEIIQKTQDKTKIDEWLVLEWLLYGQVELMEDEDGTEEELDIEEFPDCR